MPPPERPEDQTRPIRRLGFMDGEFAIPDDFDTMDTEEIRAMFEDGPLLPDEAQEG